MVDDAIKKLREKTFDERRKNSHYTLIERQPLNKMIKSLIGDNFIGTRKCGGKLEILTKTPMTDKELKDVKNMWEKREIID